MKKLPSGIVKIAEEVGFCIWNDEPWKPANATIDWSCDYDEELKAFYDKVWDMAFEHGYAAGKDDAKFEQSVEKKPGFTEVKLNNEVISNFSITHIRDNPDGSADMQIEGLTPELTAFLVNKGLVACLEEMIQQQPLNLMNKI